jgi:hypothetical protein
MNKLRGALRVYGFQDKMIVFLPLFIMLTFKVIGLDDNEGDVYKSSFSDYTFVVSFFIMMDYGFSFSIRYIMFTNFSSSRRLFFKANITAIVLKSLGISLLGTLLVAGEKVFCSTRGYEFYIIIFGNKIHEIKPIQLIIVFVMLFNYTIFVIVLGLFLTSINRLQILIQFTAYMLVTIMKASIFDRDHLSGIQSILISILLLGIALLSAIGAWFNIKKMSSVEDTFFVKLTKSLSTLESK